jgi:hypothetical protein
VLISLLGEGSVQQWSNQYGLTSPTLQDSGWAISSNFEMDGYIPSISLLGPGLEVLEVDTTWVMPGAIEQALPEAYDPPWDNYEERMGE